MSAIERASTAVAAIAAAAVGLPRGCGRRVALAALRLLLFRIAGEIGGGRTQRGGGNNLLGC